MKYDGEIDTWRVKLKNGSSVLLLADMHGETSTHHLFSILVDATKEEQERLHLEGTTPTNPERVLVSVAAFALDDVEDIQSGESWKEVPAE
ncbi:hypothetical protein [Microlunatus parietis]|uniref:Uncharacterized protein n=1 Tax=Microlunatus parietis TaxID=682979 RepID=A0A7Y9I4S7_9ACTN|nr:hypothetical protein [Microlunatus parietis]NYE70182.1 hypothetical protein [Microlunatus parietis]